MLLLWWCCFSVCLPHAVFSPAPGMLAWAACVVSIHYMHVPSLLVGAACCMQAGSDVGRGGGPGWRRYGSLVACNALTRNTLEPALKLFQHWAPLTTHSPASAASDGIHEINRGSAGIALCQLAQMRRAGLGWATAACTQSHRKACMANASGTVHVSVVRWIDFRKRSLQSGLSSVWPTITQIKTGDGGSALTLQWLCYNWKRQGRMLRRGGSRCFCSTAMHGVAEGLRWSEWCGSRSAGASGFSTCNCKDTNALCVHTRCWPCFARVVRVDHRRGLRVRRHSNSSGCHCTCKGPPVFSARALHVRLNTWRLHDVGH